MAKLRLPFSLPIETRNAEGNKDSYLKNAFVEQSLIGPTAVKRPGLETMISAYGKGLGGLWYNGALYSFSATNVLNFNSSLNYSTLVSDNIETLMALPNTLSTSSHKEAKLGLLTNNLSTYTNTEVPIPGGYERAFWTGTSFISYSQQPSIGTETSRVFSFIRSEDRGTTWEVVENITLPLGFRPTSNFIRRGSGIYLFTRQIGTPFAAGRLLSLDDGITWTHTLLGYDFVNNNILIDDICSNGTTSRYTSGYSYSNDLTTWTPCANPQFTGGIIWNGTYFLGAQSSASSANYCRSADGITWTVGTNSGLSGGFSWKKVVYDPSLEIQILWSGAQFISISTDNGITWTFIPNLNFNVIIGGGVSYIDMIAINGKFYILCRSPLYQYYIFTSINGIDWEVTDLAEPFFSYTPDIHFMD